MSIGEGLLIFLSVVSAYFLTVFILHKKGILEKYNISLFGPALMLRTKKGIFFLKKVASKNRFWKAFGSFGVVFCFVMMFLMAYLIIFQTWFIFTSLTPEIKALMPGPEVALILPGINPILPLEHIAYILFALLVAMIVHEFSHGILALAGKLKVKSLGILYLIVPLGAFCEPDDKDLKNTTTAKRMRVFAAGPMSNFVVFFICFLLFSFVFMSAVQPAGINVYSVIEDSPADDLGLSYGCIIKSINGTDTNDILDFFYALQDTKANQTVTITYIEDNVLYREEVTLADKYTYTNNVSYMGMGYLGVGPNIVSASYLEVIKHPFDYLPDSLIIIYGLPITTIYRQNPLMSPQTDSYTITGPLSNIPTNVFWGMLFMIYWIFWLNLIVGLFNVLPMVPLDGGYLFNDAVNSLVRRIKKDISDERREKIVKNISLVVSLTVLFLVIFPFFIKYL